jgi:hypothetical protein
MLSRFFQRIAIKRLEKRYRVHYERASGSDLHRRAVAIAMMELEDPWVSRALAEFSAEEQPIFLMSYECFILWVLLRSLEKRLQPAEIRELAKQVRDAFATFGRHDSAAFEKIWPYTTELMPIALKGGKDTGIVYPLYHIIEAATSAGYPLPPIFDVEIGLHILVVMERIVGNFSSDAKPDA